MYFPQPGIKRHPEKRWKRSDRIFFACGACHILAGVYLRKSPIPGFYAEQIFPGEGYSGGHLYATDGKVAFDYRGYSLRLKMLNYHTNSWCRRFNDEGWNCALSSVAFDALDTKALNANKMLGPDQYFADPMERAEAFVNRFDHKRCYEKAFGGLLN